jgi:hypothetical protein
MWAWTWCFNAAMVEERIGIPDAIYKPRELRGQTGGMNQGGGRAIVLLKSGMGKQQGTWGECTNAMEG